jgi:Uma2 family endonuclease
MAHELKRKLEYSDLQVTPDDGRRYELVRGELLVTPSPTALHQRVSKRLYGVLLNYFEGRTIGEVFYAPLDVILTNQDVFVPDLLVVADPDTVSRRGIERPPLLVVEILSPSTRRQDRGVKAQRYAELGVLHYWIVDPEARRVECYRLADGVFEIRIDAQGETTIEHPDFEGLVLDVAALWR